jgi:hypothetical protein
VERCGSWERASDVDLVTFATVVNRRARWVAKKARA